MVTSDKIRKDFNIGGEQKKIFNELVEGRPSEFKGLEKRINPDNLIYKYKTEGISPKDFKNYQNSVDLFKDGNINPKEVLKSQINFQSDLGEISGKQNVQHLFDLREKQFVFLEITPFCYLRLKGSQNINS